MSGESVVSTDVRGQVTRQSPPSHEKESDDYTDAQMLEELWGRIKGVETWRETSATVTSVARSTPEKPRRGPAEATLAFWYRPEGAEMQSGEFRVDDGCSLFNLDESDTFPIRYDPTNAERYFSPEYRIRSRLKFLSLLIAAFAIAAAYLVVTTTIRK